MIKIFLLSIILIFFTVSIPAQILNVEQYRPDKDTSHLWLGTINLGLSTKKQLNNILTYTSDLNIAYMSEKHTYMFLNHLNLVRVAGAKVISEGYFHFRWNIARKQFLSYEPFVQYQYDLGRGMNSRQLLGITGRFDLRSIEKLLLSFNTGLMYEDEVWVGKVRRYATDTSNTRAHTRFVKSTSNLGFRYKFRPGLSLFSLTYYQARFDKFFSPRIISDTQLQIQINKYLSLLTQFTITFDDNPVITNTQIIFSTNHLLVVKFP